MSLRSLPPVGRTSPRLIGRPSGVIAQTHVGHVLGPEAIRRRQAREVEFDHRAAALRFHFGPASRSGSRLVPLKSDLGGLAAMEIIDRREYRAQRPESCRAAPHDSVGPGSAARRAAVSPSDSLPARPTTRTRPGAEPRHCTSMAFFHLVHLCCKRQLRYSCSRRARDCASAVKNRSIATQMDASPSQ